MSYLDLPEEGPPTEDTPEDIEEAARLLKPGEDALADAVVAAALRDDLINVELEKKSPPSKEDEGKDEI